MTGFTSFLQDFRDFNIVTKGLKNKVITEYIQPISEILNKQKHIETEAFCIISNNANLSNSSFVVLLILSFNTSVPYLCITQIILIDLF